MIYLQVMKKLKIVLISIILVQKQEGFLKGKYTMIEEERKRALLIWNITYPLKKSKSLLKNIM